MQTLKSIRSIYQFEEHQKIAFSLVCVFLLTVAARGLAIFGISYQTDDFWSYVHGASDSGKYFLFQMGRFGWWILHESILFLGASPFGASNLFGLVYCAALIYAGYVCCKIWGINEKALPVFVVTLCIAANPFLGDSFSYRMSYPFMAAAMFLSHYALIKAGPSLGEMIFHSLLMGAAIGIYQIVVAISVAILAGQFLIWILQNTSSNLSLKNFILGNKVLFFRSGVLIFGILIYTIGNKIALGFVGVQEPATSFLQVDRVPERIIDFLKVIHYDLKCDVPLLQPIAKYAFFVLGVGVFAIAAKTIWCAEKKTIQKLCMFLIFFIGLGAMVFSLYALQFVSEAGFRQSQRVYLTSGWIVGGLVAIVCSQSRVLLKPALVLGLIFGISGLFVNNQVLSDQSRINQRDILMAARIVSQLENLADLSQVKTVVVLGGWRQYPAELQTSHWQLNNSALSEPWSKTQFLTEFSGYQFANPSVEEFEFAKKIAASMPEWPAKGSVQVNGNLAIVKMRDGEGSREYDHYSEK